MINRRSVLLVLCALAARVAISPSPVYSRPLPAALSDVPTREFIPLSEVKRGMKGIGKSVFQGTEVQSFNVEILGVLDHVNSGGDIVLIRVLDGPVVDRKCGIISGMSGSPVYIDGRLLGAIAFSWSFPKEPIAGVTPIWDMLDAWLEEKPEAKPAADQPAKLAAAAPLPKPLHVAGQEIRQVRVERGPSAPIDKLADGTMVLRPVEPLLLVSGFRQSAMPELERLFQPYGIKPVAGPGNMEGKFDAKLEPGAALGLQLVKGDLDMTAVGTVTYCWKDRLLAFGHPMFAMGKAEMPLTSAYVLDIFPSADESFKLAATGATVGKLSRDWVWSIGGQIGALPPTVPVSIGVADPDRNASRRYALQVAQHKQLTSSLILSSALECLYASFGRRLEGTAKVSLKVEAEGLPSIERSNMYYSRDGLLFETLGDLLESLSVLTENEFQKARLKSVALKVEMVDAERSAKVKRVFANRSKVKPGEEVEIGVVMELHGGEKAVKTVKMMVPKDTPGGMMRVGVSSGGNEFLLRVRLGMHIPYPTNLKDLLTLYQQLGSNNDLVVKAALPRVGVAVAGKDLPVLPSAVLRIMRDSRSTDVRYFREGLSRTVATDWAVEGAQFLTLRVDSKKKGFAEPGMPPRPQGPPPPEGEGAEGPPPSEGPPPPPPGDTTLGWRGSGEMPCARLLQWMRWANESSASSGWNAASQMAEEEEEQTENEEEQTATEERGEEEGPPEEHGTPPGKKPGPKPPSEKGPEEPGAPPGPKAKVWRESEVPHFLAGTSEQTRVTNKGDVRLAPAHRQLLSTEELYCWSIAAGSDGSIYVGSGNEGRVYQLPPAGTSKVLFDPEEIAVTCLCLDSQGNLFAGTAPGGKVYRVDKEGKASAYFDSKESFVWALALDREGKLLIGTGNAGKVFRVTAEGQGKLLCRIPQDHVRCLAVNGDGNLYVGTADDGVLYRIAPDGQMKALFESTDSEISCVAIGRSGKVYFGTSGKGGVIYCADASGRVEEFYKTPQMAVHALLSGGDGKLYAGTGNRGVVYELIEENQTVSRLSEADQAEALCLALTPKRELVAGMGNTAAVCAFSLPVSDKGTFDSKVYDAGGLSRWGSISWEAEVPAGTSLVVKSRSGNTKEADDSWSTWSVAYPRPEGSAISSPQSRYLQYRAELTANEKKESPVLKAVSVIYAPRNNKPEVSLRSPVGGEKWSGKQTLRWTGKDADQDKLTYKVFLASGTGQEWKPVPLKQEADNAVELDTGAYSDGTYRCKVVVSDVLSNPVDALSQETVSKLFILDNHPPKLLAATEPADEKQPGKRRVMMTAMDDLASIASADYRLNGGDRKVAPPADGVLDSRLEDFDFSIDAATPGEQTLELRARDAAGNTATVTRKWTAPPPPAPPKEEKKAGEQKPSAEKPNAGQEKPKEQKPKQESPEQQPPKKERQEAGKGSPPSK